MISAKRKPEYLNFVDLNIPQGHNSKKQKNPNRKWIKQILFLLFLASVFLLQSPTPVYAEEITRPANGDLTVGGESVNTSENATEGISGTNWSYDYATNTLTLTGDIISTSGYAIYAKTGDLNISVTGDVTLSAKTNFDGIYLQKGNLTLIVEQGNTLTCDGDYGGIYTYTGDCTLCGGGSIHIKNSVDETAIRSEQGDMTIRDITLYAECAGSAIFARSNLVIDNATVIAKGSSYGIRTEKTLTIQNNSTVYAEAYGTGDDDTAIYIGAELSVMGEDTTVVAGYALGDASNSYVPDITSDPISKKGIRVTNNFKEYIDIDCGHLIAAGTAKGLQVDIARCLYYGDGVKLTDTETKVEYVGSSHISDTYKNNRNSTHTRFCKHTNALKVAVETMECSGGTNTCQAGAVCTLCHETYGTINADNHTSDTHTNGFRDCCGVYEPAVDSDNDGYYEIKNAGNLFWFAEQVNARNTTWNAILTDNIDLENRAWTPIGSETVVYSGVFDGGNYTISNFSHTAATGWNGFIGHLNGTEDTKAVLKNLTIKGTITISTDGIRKIGLVGESQNAVVENVHSYIDITAANGKGIHIGGIVGCSEGNTTIIQCSNYGAISAGESRENIGGIAGYAKNGDSISYCANYGTITNSGTNTYMGGILGYINNTSFGGIQNCLNVGSVSCAIASDYVGAIIGRPRNYADDTITNNYYLDTSAASAFGKTDKTTTTAIATAKTFEALKSGEAAYLLNGTQENIIFKQTIGTQDYPKFTGDIVYYSPDMGIFYTNTPVFSITFDAGGVGVTGSMTDVKLTEGYLYTLPENAWTVEGKLFRAWSIDGTKYAVGDTYEITKDVVITAIWEDEVVSIDITWTAMEFTYVKGAWNPSTYTYSEGTWQPTEDGGKIMIANTGNTDVNVEVVFAPQIENLSGVFDTEELSTSVKNKMGMELKKEEDVTVLLELRGIPTEELQKETIGTVTVTITKTQ